MLLVSLRDKPERPILSRTRLNAEQVLEKTKCASLGFKIIVLYHAVKYLNYYSRVWLNLTKLRCLVQEPYVMFGYCVIW